MDLPLVSVVVPCYNHEKYIQKCIQSIIDQDYVNIELIIIDDGSSDASVEKVQELALACESRFSRFKFISRSNKGLCATLNEAIALCEGELYSAIASDDAMLPFKTRIQVEFLEMNPDCDAVFGGVNMVDDEDRVIHERVGKLGKYGFKELFLKAYSPPASTQMIRLSSLKAAGKYPVKLYIEDWYMWLRMTSLGFQFGDVGHILVNYRRHSTNISGNLEEMNAAKEQILADYSAHPLYHRARAASKVSSALDIQPVSKTSSVRFMCSAIFISPEVMFRKQFYRCLLKFFVPKKFIGRKKA